MTASVFPVSDAGQEPNEPPTAASVARDVNAAIYDMAASLDRLVSSGRPVGFLCECGCMEIAPATLAAYEAAGGVWLAEHRPT
ncbi:MAG TPA: hypothetical protein VJ814_03305 [Gaiellaceae bacterium]|nr:hypothetical protein [Gaiellaceae bacterium]